MEAAEAAAAFAELAADAALSALEAAALAAAVAPLTVSLPLMMESMTLFVDALSALNLYVKTHHTRLAVVQKTRWQQACNHHNKQESSSNIQGR